MDIVRSGGRVGKDAQRDTQLGRSEAGQLRPDAQQQPGCLDPLPVPERRLGIARDGIRERPTDAPDVGPGPARMHPVGEQHDGPATSPVDDQRRAREPRVAHGQRAAQGTHAGRIVDAHAQALPEPRVDALGQLVAAHLGDGRLGAGRGLRRARHPAGSSRPGVPGPRPCRTPRHAPRRRPATTRSRRGRCPGACLDRRTTRPRSPRSGRQVPPRAGSRCRPCPADGRPGRPRARPADCPVTASASQPAVMKPRSEYANAAAAGRSSGAPSTAARRDATSGQSVHRLSSGGSPEVWLSRWRSETDRRTPTANVGSHGWIGPSSVRAPSSTRLSSTVVVNSLVRDARSNSVSARIGTWASAGSSTPAASAYRSACPTACSSATTPSCSTSATAPG